jgi:hypothetical protein
MRGHESACHSANCVFYFVALYRSYMAQKSVYVGMSTDMPHPGYLNIISTTRKYREVIVGLLTDKAMPSYIRH